MPMVPAAATAYRFGALDPRALLLAATGAALVFSCLRTPAVAGGCLLLAVALAGAVRLPPGPILKQLAVVNVFILFLWLTVPLTIPGDCVARLGPLCWSREGLRLAALVTLKCNAIVLVGITLTAGMELPLIGCALERLWVPAKLVFLFLFTCRYIHVIGHEWHRLRTAADLRGFVPRTSLHTYRTFGNMLGLTFINAIDRSHRIYEAMLLRGFDGTFHTVTELRSRRRDRIFLLVFFLFLAAVLLLDRGVG
ncbi:MAG: cobalt ECF transporter T component CbiQ [Planctomycetes bacterium]|nr:cobalt ECF transporter T component CbiQ [Planctomycetota bacterium]